MHDTRLDSRMLERHLAFLKDKGLIDEQPGGLKTTEKGLEFLRRYRALARMLDED